MPFPHETTPRQQPPADPEAPEILDRREGPYGEVVLRRQDGLLQIIANGCFLMDTSDGRSERLLVRAAAEALDGHAGAGSGGPRLLIGGLGVGFSLAEAAAEERWSRITVVEREEAVIDWHRAADRAPYAPFSRISGLALADTRVGIAHADLLDHLRTTEERYEALALDIDNGPDWTVTDGNLGLYGEEGLALLERTMAPGAVLAVWSASDSPGFEARLRARFITVRRLDVPVVRGTPDVVYLASQTS